MSAFHGALEKSSEVTPTVFDTRRIITADELFVKQDRYRPRNSPLTPLVINKWQSTSDTICHWLYKTFLGIRIEKIVSE